MNFSRYGSIYSQFHGATTFRIEQDVIILDLVEESFDNWILVRMFRFNEIHMRPQKAFTKALQVYLKSQAPMTVFCENDSWIALSGREKYVAPIVREHANFQMYATPYFVHDPSTLLDYMQAHSDTVFMNKNCIIYLDKEDLPHPGGCYFKSRSQSTSMYRICMLSREPLDKVLRMASEWKTRRDVMTIPFSTSDTISVPAMIAFHPIQQPYLPDDRAKSTGNIQKRLSLYQPQCLIHDIIMSYQRNTQQPIKDLGLVIEWPFRLTYEGTRFKSNNAAKQFVALVVNGFRPTRTVFVRYPYEVYTEYSEVPSIPFITIQFVSTILDLPPDMEKVSVDSTVIGYKYRNGFHCFSFPILEGRPTSHISSNVSCLFTSPKESNAKDIVQDTFYLEDNFVLVRVKTETEPFSAWYISETNDAHKYPEAAMLPKLVNEWITMFRHVDSKVKGIDFKMVQMALTLARHKICFKTKIETKAKRNQIEVTDTDIELCQSPEEIQFINSRRAEVGPPTEFAGENKESCSIM